MSKVVMIMGSKADLDWANQIVKTLDAFVITSYSIHYTKLYDLLIFAFL